MVAKQGTLQRRVGTAGIPMSPGDEKSMVDVICGCIAFSSCVLIIGGQLLSERNWRAMLMLCGVLSGINFLTTSVGYRRAAKCERVMAAIERREASIPAKPVIEKTDVLGGFKLGSHSDTASSSDGALAWDEEQKFVARERELQRTRRLARREGRSRRRDRDPARGIDMSRLGTRSTKPTKKKRRRRDGTALSSGRIRGSLIRV